MSANLSRRTFVAGSVTAGLAGLVDLPFLAQLPIPAAVARPRKAALSSDIEPLVRLIEDTPRAQLLDRIAERIRGGTSYQDLLAGVFLAGVRGIQPRPVGFKFHAVLVINSAHLASQAAEDRDRWLPLLWSLDYFKGTQATNYTQGDWRLAPPSDESLLPSAASARTHLAAGLDNWEPELTDRAMTALVRNAGLNDIFELLWVYGARDFRNIGHKAIYVANSYRTLQAIGDRHAEPVLRSVVYALLDHSGGNPARRDEIADRTGRENMRLARAHPRLGQAGRPDDGATRALLDTLRTASYRQAADQVVELWKKEVHPRSVWDGLFLGAGELLMRQPGIVGLHAITTVNALHFAHQNAASADTRRFLMLQAASFLPLFRQAMQGRGGMAARWIDRLEPADPTRDAVADIFTAIGPRTPKAAEQVLGLLQREPGRLPELTAAARRLVFAKGRDSHDYKFSSAALEDAYHVSPAWRARFAASSVFNLRGSGEADNALVRRARALVAR